MSDLIYRQDAIDAVAEGLKRVFVEYRDVAEKMINKLPSAQPQRTGRWELIDDTEFRVPGYRCSVCHCECEDWDKKPTYRFCPNCGADMRGEQDG